MERTSVRRLLRVHYDRQVKARVCNAMMSSRRQWESAQEAVWEDHHAAAVDLCCSAPEELSQTEQEELDSLLAGWTTEAETETGFLFSPLL